MGGVAEVLRRRIATTGPITVAEFMETALGHSRYGYYLTRDPFGVAGDFTTAPEISQMFGELVGLWCAVVWRTMGEPDPFVFAELGPGRGTLMADALRATLGVPGFHAAARLHLVETSPLLRARQRNALGPAAASAEWHDTFAGLPPGPLVLVANEFLDALPIRQFQRSAQGWSERMIDSGDGGFRFVLGPPHPVAALVPAALARAREGSIVEVSPAASALAHSIATRIAAAGGAALLVDYGHGLAAAGDTLQAVKAHAFHPVLAAPGEADLTHHVDFAALAEAARTAGARVLGPVAQGDFLAALGIRERAAMLTASASAVQAHDVHRALNRLVDAAEMGTLFKAMALTHPGLAAPPGFE